MLKIYFQKRNEFQKQRQIKKEIKDKKLVLKKNLSNQFPLWKNTRKYQALDYFNIPITTSSMIILLLLNYIEYLISSAILFLYRCYFS